MAKIHKGSLINCPVCSGYKAERKERRVKRTGITAEIAVRRQAAAEASAENPLARLEKDAILMKYGVSPTVIDRNIKMPLWKAEDIRQKSDRSVEVVWNNMMQDWFNLTKGLVAAQRAQRSSAPGYTKVYSRPNPKFRGAKAPYPKSQNVDQMEGRKWNRQSSNNRPSSPQTDKSTRSPQT